MPELLQESFHFVLLAIGLALAALAGSHALLNKRDPRSAAAWVTIVFLFPLLGALLYATFGVNRIRTRARQLHDMPREFQASAPLTDGPDATEVALDDAWLNLARLGRAVSANPVVAANRVEVLVNGDNAYPAMRRAIASAEHTVWIASYIFEVHGEGAALVDALREAAARGVQVRVLVDGVGDLYAWPRASSTLKKRGLTVARFLPPGPKPPAFAINLRNHRKVLVVDNRIAYTGGMNIRSRHVAGDSAQPGIADVHFELQGAIVDQLSAVFEADWHFATNEKLVRPALPESGCGDAACRVVIDGPNEDLDKIIWMLVNAVGLARSRICIMTPYFSPPRELIVALQTAALRGVSVEILLPAHNNFPFMTWAAVHALGPLLRTGARVGFVEGPFVHSKLFVVDDYYAQIGSSNLDHRSLRLNFELAVEVYDADFAHRIGHYFDQMGQLARFMNYADWKARQLPERLRDGLFWLLSPYI